jgi:hypothetical protein
MEIYKHKRNGKNYRLLGPIQVRHRCTGWRTDSWVVYMPLMPDGNSEYYTRSKQEFLIDFEKV